MLVHSSKIQITQNQPIISKYPNIKQPTPLAFYFVLDR
jgi:hypothetical protein